MLHPAVSADGQALARLAQRVVAGRLGFARLEAAGRRLVCGGDRAMAHHIVAPVR
jgi:hypothetical protein